MARYCPNLDCPALTRDGVVAEFRDTVTECLDCGAGTVFGDGREAAAARSPEVEYHELVTIFWASDAVQGQIVASSIEAAGVPVFVKGELLQGAIGELPPSISQVEIQVPVDRAEQAREIALRWEGPTPPDVVSSEEAEVDHVVAAVLEKETSS